MVEPFGASAGMSLTGAAPAVLRAGLADLAAVPDADFAADLVAGLAAGLAAGLELLAPAPALALAIATPPFAAPTPSSLPVPEVLLARVAVLAVDLLVVLADVLADFPDFAAGLAEVVETAFVLRPLPMAA